MTPASRWTVPPVLRGMYLIARGRPHGLNCFRDSPRAFFASLAPGLGILVGAVLQGLADGSGLSAIDAIPGTLCVLLAPSVVSYELARIWGREAFWNRYIVAFNWCQWLLPLVGLVLLFGLTLAPSAGGNAPGGLRVLIVCLAIYALWLNWFLARHGLALTAWRAAGMVAAVNLGTVALVLIPTVLASSFE